MLIVAAAVIAATPGVPVIDQKIVRTIAPLCQPIAPQTVRKADGPAVRNLAKEPPADAIAAVLYTEGQCSKPIVISKGIGNKPAGKAKAERAVRPSRDAQLFR